MSRKTVLTFTTTSAPVFVKIDGIPYRMNPPHGLGLTAYHELMSNSSKAGDLQQRYIDRAVTEAEERELMTLVDPIVRIALDLPEGVFAKLGGMQRLAIAEAYASEVLLSQQATIAKPTAKGKGRRRNR